MKIYSDKDEKGFVTEDVTNKTEILLDDKILRSVPENANIIVDSNYTFYQIQEYQSKWDRWIQLGDGWGGYLKKYEYGDMTACGSCWQTTNCHGTFNKEYAVQVLCDLKTTMIKLRACEESGDELSDELKQFKECTKGHGKNVTDFRIIKIHSTLTEYVIV